MLKNMCDSWEEVKPPVLTGDWEKLSLSLTDNSEGFQTSVEDIMADVETAGKLELEVEPEDAPQWLQSHDKIRMDEELPLRMSKASGFLDEVCSCEDAVKMVDIAAKNLVRSFNLLIKQQQ